MNTDRGVATSATSHRSQGRPPEGLTAGPASEIDPSLVAGEGMRGSVYITELARAAAIAWTRGDLGQSELVRTREVLREAHRYSRLFPARRHVFFTVLRIENTTPFGSVSRSIRPTLVGLHLELSSSPVDPRRRATISAMAEA